MVLVKVMRMIPLSAWPRAQCCEGQYSTRQSQNANIVSQCNHESTAVIAGVQGWGFVGVGVAALSRGAMLSVKEGVAIHSLRRLHGDHPPDSLFKPCVGMLVRQSTRFVLIFSRCLQMNAPSMCVAHAAGAEPGVTTRDTQLYANPRHYRRHCTRHVRSAW